MKKSYSLAAALVLLASFAYSQTATTPVTARAAARFLDQCTWGPTPASIAQVQSMGFQNWLNAQFALNTSNLPDQPLLTAAGKQNNNLAPVQAAFFQNTVANNDQLRQRIAFVLSQIWVVSQQSGVPNAYAYPPYWRILRDNAFGNYRDIIKAVTLSPAMGRYLNMANNNKANAATGSAANENYARELMQLFTVGLTQLNMDGSPVMQNGASVPTYTQAVVTSTAAALTGWTYPTAPNATPKNNNPNYYIGTMFAVESEHDTTQKTTIGNVTIPAGQTAEQDLDSVIDALMAQPTMAPFISKQLIEHLVTSNPSPGYIQRVATVFGNNGYGVSGDMKAVITAILLDQEARNPDDPSYATPSYYGHMREPVLFFSNVLRGTNATVAATSTLGGEAANMGENLFNEPSVFSYFSPASRTEFGLTAPEFQIYSTQTAVDRVNYTYGILYGAGKNGFTVNLAPFAAVAGDTVGLLDYISNIFLHGGMSAELQQAATTAVNAQTTATAKAQAALYVVLTSSEYQIIQ